MLGVICTWKSGSVHGTLHLPLWLRVQSSCIRKHFVFRSGLVLGGLVETRVDIDNIDKKKEYQSSSRKE